MTHSARGYDRADRLSEQIRRELGRIVEERARDVFAGLVTITRVTVTRDLREAKILYSYLGNTDEREAVAGWFAREQGHLRSAVGGIISVRYVPELSFHYDESIEAGIRLEKLFDDIRNNRHDA